MRSFYCKNPPLLLAAGGFALRHPH